MKKIINIIFSLFSALMSIFHVNLGRKTKVFIWGIKTFISSLFVYVSVVLIHEGFLREEYEEKAAKISSQASAMAVTNSIDSAAHWAVKARNDLKVEIREKGNPITQRLAEQRNQKKYGNPIGPSYQFLENELAKKGIPKEDVSKEIIKSAGTANKTVSQEAKNMKLFGIGLFIGYCLVTIFKISRLSQPHLRFLAILRSILLVFISVFGGMIGVKLFSQINLSPTTEIDTYITSLIGIALFCLPLSKLSEPLPARVLRKGD